jgi:Icc-related predicted phosphoesterase
LGIARNPFYDGAFGLSSPADWTRLYATIPDDVDILVTHGPPYGILDASPGALHHAGCPQLLEAVARLKPKLHVFGHVHGAHGMLSTEDTLFVNAALLGPDGDLDASPIVLRMSEV